MPTPQHISILWTELTVLYYSLEFPFSTRRSALAEASRRESASLSLWENYVVHTSLLTCNAIASADNTIASADNAIASANNPIASANNPIASADNAIASADNAIASANNAIASANNAIASACKN